MSNEIFNVIQLSSKLRWPTDQDEWERGKKFLKKRLKDDEGERNERVFREICFTKAKKKDVRANALMAKKAFWGSRVVSIRWFEDKFSSMEDN